jgi:hypothetical protein
LGLGEAITASAAYLLERVDSGAPNVNAQRVHTSLGTVTNSIQL